MTNPVNSQLLRARMVERGKAPADVAAACGMTVSTFYRKLRGVSEFTMGDIQATRQCLSLSTDDVERIFLSRTENNESIL